MSNQSYSIVKYSSEQKRDRCGYCKSPDTNFSYGMWAETLTVQDYQALIDRGWRRSGHYCYKPHMDQTCCPAYTIRCEALKFNISKSQKKILKRMGKFLRNELQNDDIMDTSEDHRDVRDIGEFPIYNKYLQETEENASEMNVKSVSNKVNLRLQPNVLDKEKTNNLENQQKQSESVPCASNHNEDSHVASQSVKSIEMNSSRGPCKKAKLLRIERKQKKLLAQGKTQNEIEAIFKEHKQQNHAKSIEELFSDMYGETNRLKLKLVRTSPMSSGYQKTSKISYMVYKKFETIILGEPTAKVTEERYTRFLVRSPLQQWKPNDGPPCGYGSFHEQYWLDNELIAVGVIDILPSCVSSVYFFYDPAYSHLSLGTFSSLREVCLTRELNRASENLKYYYMGFYIHTCPKMRYKARMKPSKLLCPETYAWFDIEPCLKKLDKEKYSRLNDDIDAIDENGIVNVNKVYILHGQIAMTYKIYKARTQHIVSKEDEDIIEEYARLVGMKLARSLLFYRR
ncbi:arginyl-tRNA--protein transferase 1 isoform X1 [Hylaeus volcanicus]|uniref:arginyl-tRNA--protein transferase 1 isoform X1 n=1 Tax=Hylaeus volcanicus TaxID=313075 RepID=UPI0023B7A1A1|nr:arginyl-tRNA--protein transferase 1 isoform X1 [Hylaeus volcanicus]XP_053983185.1 arginyl-tRNA--protein transferase 1 isoform X1 [Hylaeus volcanicus]